MRLFMCFGASAAVVDDDVDAAGGGIEAVAVAARRRRHHQRVSSSFRGKFLSSGSRKDCDTKKPSAPAAELKKREVEADAYGLMIRVPAASPVPSSAALSSAASLDSSSSSASSSSRSSSPSVSGVVLFPPPAAKRRASKAGSPATTTSPAAGAAVVALCLLMVVFCGRVGATVLASSALYLFPRRWPARSSAREEEDGVVDSLECDAEEETTAKREVVTVLRRGSCVGEQPQGLTSSDEEERVNLH